MRPHPPASTVRIGPHVRRRLSHRFMHLSNERVGRALEGTRLLSAFGVLMLATAAFSHRPWVADAPYDHVEDLLHSITASAMGFAFAAGVVAVGVSRRGPSRLDRGADTVAVVASVVIPLAMAQGTAYTGLLQRSMFLVAYIWYAREGLRGAL